MQNNIYRLVYCSRNRLTGGTTEIRKELARILASSRKNNVPMNVTGALLYTDGNFAQVLEGPLSSVERIFEVIQRDSRHSEVTVVQCGPISERDFPEWSMAFMGSSDAQTLPIATAAFESVFANTAGAGEQMLLTLKELVISEEEWILLDAA